MEDIFITFQMKMKPSLNFQASTLSIRPHTRASCYEGHTAGHTTGQIIRVRGWSRSGWEDCVGVSAPVIANSNTTRRHTHSNHMWVYTQVFPISTSYISKPAASRERGQELAHAGPGRMASAAEMGSDGVVHSVHIFFFQMSCISVTGGQWGERRFRGWWGLLTVTGRGEGWEEEGLDGERLELNNWPLQITWLLVKGW